MRYCKLLTQESSRVAEHAPCAHVGTHINVSKGGSVMSLANLAIRQTAVDSFLYRLDWSAACKYFGRIPYGYGYVREAINGRFLIEWKLFNSTNDAATLKRYINIAVALTDLMYSSQSITMESVMIALEYGYNRNKFGKWNSLYAPTATSA